MNEKKPTGPAQPNQIERPESDKREASTKQPERQKPKDDEVLPGADGFRSAGANEDTYD